MNKRTEDMVKSFHYMTEQEVEALTNLAKDLPDDSVIVNLDVEIGTSSMAIIEERPELAHRFISIDPRMNNNPFGGLYNERNAFTSRGMEKYLPKQITMNQWKAGAEYKVSDVDVLILTAKQAEEGLLEAWESKLAPCAYIVLKNCSTSFTHDDGEDLLGADGLRVYRRKTNVTITEEDAKTSELVIPDEVVTPSKKSETAPQKKLAKK